MTVGVIGAGASGIIAALKASEKNHVLLFDSNDKCGKKILATGNGKCNYWNENISVDKYNTDNFELLEEIISQNNINEVLDYISSLGIYPKIKNGYYYPFSGQAYSIREIFEYEINNRDIERIYNYKVTNIVESDNGFKIYSDSKCYIVDKVIISTGSKAAPKTGSDGDGYIFARRLGLKINNIYPSLVQLRCKSNYLRELNGIRCDAIVSLYADNQFIKEEQGELQFTDYGLSGICIFNLSGIVSRNLNNKKMNIGINFLPFASREWLNDFLININKPISHSLESLFNFKIINVILKEIKISDKAYYKSLTDIEKNRLFDIIFNYKYDVISTNDFDKAQVCTGGVSLNEINSNMQLINNKNIYITGELLDVDGICGGYNLAFAFISGYLAGKDI